jgi:small subunit ribosomal protein S10
MNTRFAIREGGKTVGAGVVTKIIKYAKKTAKTESTPKLRLAISAFESKILDISVKKILETAEKYDAKVIGPVPMPTKIRKYTVLRSSFVYKNAREQFEMRTHKRVLDIVNPTGKLTEALTNLALPSGVDVEVKMM